MIEVRNLAKTFGDISAVKDVSFTALKGDVVGFLGPNGAGKTTTIRLLTTYLAPTSGTAQVAGLDIVSESEKVREVIGYLPESPALYPELTVLEYLRFMARIRGVARKQLKKAVANVVESCALGEMRSRLCGHLSKGYKQRVGLAQAIVHDPSVIILDEPTSGLDPQQVLHMRDLVKELAKKRTVLVSTHILSEVSALCSKVVIVNRGRTIVEESLAALPQDRSLERVFLDAIGSAESGAAFSVHSDSPAVNDDSLPEQAA